MISCSEKNNTRDNELNSLAEQYVQLGLNIGQYDPDFVDAYYGPDSLKPKTDTLAIFPKDSLLNSVAGLKSKLNEITSELSDTGKIRAGWMSQQLTAFDRRIRIFSGEFKSFDEESKDLFGISAPVYPESHYAALLDSLNKILPGEGDVQSRFQKLANQFIIPKDKLDTVFRATIGEARRKTKEHYELPADESFSIEYVNNKPWSGYNWYKGNFTSIIQINTDTQIFLERAIDVGSHESYPGHHVYNMLLEKNLYRDKGWVEISLYPLFSPQSFIAEGSANYGVELAFPGDNKIRFANEKLLPMAGLDTTNLSLYFKALAIRSQLNYARNEAGRGLVNGTMNEKQALDWLIKYCLYNEETALKSISFIKKYRSYIINYNYGMDLVKQYVEAKAGYGNDAKKQWEVFGQLLSNPVLPGELLIK
ncbi:MAG: hypothetical protein B7X86_03265 [Sphingobacteriales bacterium 17-39-43]|nr:MAG: hypothetical protein B7Y24_04090 [Sphingobacteriales bacterium 16-39-50]OYZ59100.1 MAG: hypothetical protein B7Y19_01575 [Sphingobacteriales bacterium 24-40-4]OZA25957.1 MAG: hypothetical protein B7X86_03265 [Sphingobacteriales bacterium 17-39-43]